MNRVRLGRSEHNCLNSSEDEKDFYSYHDSWKLVHWHHFLFAGCESDFDRHVYALSINVIATKKNWNIFVDIDEKRMTAECIFSEKHLLGVSYAFRTYLICPQTVYVITATAPSCSALDNEKIKAKREINW